MKMSENLPSLALQSPGSDAHFNRQAGSRTHKALLNISQRQTTTEQTSELQSELFTRSQITSGKVFTMWIGRARSAVLVVLSSGHLRYCRTNFPHRALL